MSSDWCTIESDPGVFTSLIESFGVRNAQLTELWSIDDDSLSQLVQEYGKVYGLIFLFKWQSSANTAADGGSRESSPLTGDQIPEDLFFAKQVTTNACATQAILSILLNSPSSSENEAEDLVLGDMLTNLKNFTSSFPPDLRGEAIGASDDIRTAHNSFSRRESFLMDNSVKRIATDDDDVFHFVAYVPHKSSVYELDGLQSGPIPIGEVESNGNDGDCLQWLKTARTSIQKRIEKYASSEIKFNLMALTRDKRCSIHTKVASIMTKMVDNGSGGNGEPSQSSLESDLNRLNADLAAEEELRSSWKIENDRRRHNYVPFCVELIKGLARSGLLEETTVKARERMMAASKMGGM